MYVKLQPYRQKFVANKKCLKLATKYFGPYKVLDHISAIAYKFELPDEAKTHPVFHVSQLKKHLGGQLAQSHLPIMYNVGLIAKEPLAIMGRRMNKRKG